MRTSTASDALIHFGCGLTAPAGWRNFDSSLTLRVKRTPVLGLLLARTGARFPANVEFGDVTRRLPVPDGAARLVYCSHVLEHLPLDGLRAAFAETFRILAPGGIFRLVMPDLEQLVDEYKASAGDDAAVRFIGSTLMGQEDRRTGLAALRGAIGNSAHRWLWDYKATAMELRAAGFGDVRRAAFGDNPDPALAEVEDETRWQGALGVECRKP